MTKAETLEILCLLSALESAFIANRLTFPDYLHERLADALMVLEREILK